MIATSRGRTARSSGPHSPSAGGGGQATWGPAPARGVPAPRRGGPRAPPPRPWHTVRGRPWARPAPSARSRSASPTRSSKTSASASLGRAGPTRLPEPAALRDRPRLSPGALRVLARALRLAGPRGPTERVPPVHRPARRDRAPLHPRAGRRPDPLPLLLSHGWPGSVWEFNQLLPRLTDPARFGADPADAFTVVAPSLPGYGFSFRAGPAALRRPGDRRGFRGAHVGRSRLPAIRSAGGATGLCP